MSTTLAVGTRIRYKPGTGTYGYEDDVEEDGRIPGIVMGFTSTRVRVRLTLRTRISVVMRAVDAKSLVVAP